MNDIKESTEADIEYGKVSYLTQIACGEPKIITRNYPVKFCHCGKQITVKKSKCYKTKRFVFPSVKRFEILKTCGDDKCIKQANYTKRLKPIKKSEFNKKDNRTSITGMPVDPAVRRVHQYFSKCGF